MNKLTKLLSVFLIAGVVGTGAAAVGCTQRGHEHTAGENWHQDETSHWHVCKEDETILDKADHADSDNDGKCDECDYVLGFIAPAGVTGLVVEGYGDETVTLSATKKSHTIDKNAIKVYLRSGATKGAEVPSDYYELKLYRGGLDLVTNWENITDDADFVIEATLKGVVDAEGKPVTGKRGEVTVSIKNPVTAVTLKTGTTTQVQSSTNSMTDWTYEATRANGDKFDVDASKITVGVMDTVTVGSHTVDITYGKVTGSVTYTITADQSKISQSYAINFTYLSAADKASIVAGNAVSLQNDRFVVQSSTGGSVDSHKKTYDDKYIAERLKVNGSSSAKNCARYIKVHADGAGTITVIAYNNGGTLGDGNTRGVSLYASRTPDPAGDTYANQVGTTAAIPSKDHATVTFSVTAAGDYYITCDAAMTYCYVQLDQLVDSSNGAQEVVLTGEDDVGAIEIVKPQTAPTFKVNGTFNHEGYSVKATVVNKTTLKSEVKDVTAQATFTTPDMTVPGKKDVSVSYGGLSDGYSITVYSEVDGIYGIKASLAASVNVQVESAASKLTLTKDDIKVALLGENAEATVTAYTAKINDVEITTGTELPVGEYVIKVTATVTAGAQTATISDDIELEVSVKPAAGSLANVIVGSTEAKAAAGTHTAAKDLYSGENGRVFITASAAGSVIIEDNSKSYGDKSFTQRIKLGGEGTVAARAIGVEVKTGSTIVIYAMSSSSSASRDMRLMDADGNALSVTSTLDEGAMGQLDGASLHKVTYTVTAPGTYYFGSVSGGINVYGVEILYA